MAKRKKMENTACPVARSLDVIGDRWSLMIVRDAFDNMRRFSDFQRNLGVARNILANRLRKLVDAKILEIRPASDGSAYQEYVLSPKGEALFTVIVALRQWGENHLFQSGEIFSHLIENTTGESVKPMIPLDSQGKPLRAAATSVKKVSPKEYASS